SSSGQESAPAADFGGNRRLAVSSAANDAVLPARVESSLHQDTGGDALPDAFWAALSALPGSLQALLPPSTSLATILTPERAVLPGHEAHGKPLKLAAYPRSPKQYDDQQTAIENLQDAVEKFRMFEDDLAKLSAE